MYASGSNLWKSSDHGKSWTQVSKIASGTGTAGGGRVIVGFDLDPRYAKTIWISATTWDGSSNGGIFKTTDGGATWQDITGHVPYVKPLVLRFNPATNDLWAGGVGLYKLKQ